MPAEVEFSEMTFVNATASNNEISEKSSPRGFKSFVRYDCNPGYVAVGRSLLMCDVDERWNGPPPRCEPVYCPEPPSIRHGGMSLSSNSTAFQTVSHVFNIISLRLDWNPCIYLYITIASLYNLQWK